MDRDYYPIQLSNDQMNFLTAVKLKSCFTSLYFSFCYNREKNTEKETRPYRDSIQTELEELKGKRDVLILESPGVISRARAEITDIVSTTGI